MKKGMKIGIILKNLKDEVFSGSCSLACEDHIIDLVLQDGNIMLASCDSSCGNPAMDMIAKLNDHAADASLSDLTPAQMKLTLEFNTQCRVRQRRAAVEKVAVDKDTTEKAAIEKPPVIQKDESKSARKMDIPKIVAAGPVIEEMQISPTTPLAPEPRSPQKRTTPSPPALHKGKMETPSAHGGEEYTMVDRDLKALDSMDLDTMSHKIRANCKLMIEKLHLEHLIENQED